MDVVDKADAPSTPRAQREQIEMVVDIAMEKHFPAIDEALQGAVRQAALLNEQEVLRILEPIIARINALEKALVILAGRVARGDRTISNN